MTGAGPLSVTTVGEPLAYRDGAEEAVRAALEAADDRSVGSEELAAAVRDWPTAYHLAPERAMLLAPVEVAPGERVLDIGAGTGVNTRLMADRGAHVTAVEAATARAELIALRCAGLDDVDVLCGPVAKMPEGLPADRRAVWRGGFDLVLLVGVLEYAVGELGGGEGPAALLAKAAEAVGDRGAVVVAIENRLGLKYLLGYPEDHLGLPWVGYEGYEGWDVQTWTRKALGALLDDAGLVAQRWLHPFPDYKLPVTVVDEAVYERADAADLVEQLVGHPTSTPFSVPLLVSDARAAHRTLVEAGLGAHVANSFCVVAARSPQALAGRVSEETLVWRAARDRYRHWTQLRQVMAVPPPVADGAGAVSPAVDPALVVRSRRLEPAEGPVADEWLRQVEVAEEPWYAGRNLEQELLDAARMCRQRCPGSSERITELLAMWRAALAAEETVVSSVSEPHPYLPADTTRVLPPEWLDCAPDNFVQSADGLRFVDREWQAVGGVDVRLAVVRGLWKTAFSLLSSGFHLPWPVTWTNDRLVWHFGQLIGEDIGPELLERWREAEADLIRRVFRQPDNRLYDLHELGGRHRMLELSSPLAPYRQLEHQVQMLHEEPAAMAEAYDLAQDQLAEMSGALARPRLARVAKRLVDRLARLRRRYSR